MAAPPPSYEAATSAANTGIQDTKPSPASSPPQTQPSSRSASYIFPPAFGFYHASGSISDLRISLTQESPSIFHISTHGAFSSQPSIILHATASPISQPLATADFRSFSISTDITVRHPRLVSTSLQKDGMFSAQHSFTLPGVGAFEWKSSSGNEVASLRGRGRGMKLVVAGTGEVVAAWSPPNSGTRKKGKMAFLGRSREVFGGVWEMMAVISVLALMEKARRRRNNSAAGAAGGAGC